MGQTGFCENLRFPAVSCENLHQEKRKSAKICEKNCQFSLAPGSLKLYSEPEKMQFHTPSHSIPPLDSLLHCNQLHYRSFPTWAGMSASCVPYPKNLSLFFITSKGYFLFSGNFKNTLENALQNNPDGPKIKKNSRLQARLKIRATM